MNKIVLILATIVFTGCASKEYVTVPKEDLAKLESAYRERIQNLEKREMLLRIEHNKELTQVNTRAPRNTECKFLCF